MAIYTKTGDKGETGIIAKRVSKSSKIINAIGAIDEVNSYIGICLDFVKNPEAREKLVKIQGDLFTIGAVLAGADIKLDHKRVLVFEEEIDRLEGQLPVLNHFILPGGNALASHLFFLRTLVRRSERSLVEIKNLDAEILRYINRLSDYFFVVARQVNFKDGKMETIWPSPQNIQKNNR